MAWPAGNIYYGTSNDSADVTDGTDSNVTLEATEPVSGSVASSLGGGESADVITFTSAANDPNLTEWQSGDFIAQVNVSKLGADVTWGIEINRVNSSGANIENLADSGVVHATASVQTLTWSNASAKTVAAGDRIQIVVKATRGASHGNQSCDVSIGTGVESTTTKLTVPTAAQNYSMPADSGSYIETGTDASLEYNRVVSSDSGNYLLTGTAAILAKSYTVTSDSGTYALTGTDAGLIKSSIISSDSVNYILTGTDAGLQKTYTLSVDPGSYSHTGTSSSLIKDSVVVSQSGSYLLTGTDASLEQSRSIQADPGSYTLTGSDVTLTVASDKTLVASSGSYVLTGTDAGLINNSSISAQSGAYSYTGDDAGTIKDSLISAQTESYLLTGTSANLIQSKLIQANPGSYIYTGSEATLTHTSNNPTLSVESGVFTLNGFNASLINSSQSDLVNYVSSIQSSIKSSIK